MQQLVLLSYHSAAVILEIKTHFNARIFLFPTVEQPQLVWSAHFHGW